MIGETVLAEAFSHVTINYNLNYIIILNQCDINVTTHFVNFLKRQVRIFVFFLKY